MENQANAFFTDLVKRCPTYNSVLYCVMRDGLFLRSIPDVQITTDQAYEIAMAAVTQNGLALEFVRPDHFSKEQYAVIVAAALAQNAAARKFID